jgi:hypothetical protein
VEAAKIRVRQRFGIGQMIDAYEELLVSVVRG